MTLETDGIISELPLHPLLRIQFHSSNPSAEADHLLKYSSLPLPLVDCRHLPYPTFLFLTHHIIPIHNISRCSLKTNYTNLPEKQEMKLSTETASYFFLLPLPKIHYPGVTISSQQTTWYGLPLFSVLILRGLSRSWLNTLFSSFLWTTLPPQANPQNYNNSSQLYKQQLTIQRNLLYSEPPVTTQSRNP